MVFSEGVGGSMDQCPVVGIFGVRERRSAFREDILMGVKKMEPGYKSLHLHLVHIVHLYRLTLLLLSRSSFN